MQRIAGLLIAFAATVTMTGCGSGDDNTTPVAVVGPITGQYASFGAQMKNGGDLAVEAVDGAALPLPAIDEPAGRHASNARRRGAAAQRRSW